MNDVRKALLEDENLALIGKDSEGKEYKTFYTIKSIAGYGGSSIVYKAVRTEKVVIGNEECQLRHHNIIKEFYPLIKSKTNPLEQNISRGLDGTLVVSKEFEDEFIKHKNRFLRGYGKHVNFYEDSPNQTLQAPAIFTANNTVYTIMELGEGNTLDKCRSELSSIHDIVEVMISLVTAIKCYHTASERLVHLDIKPENIYKYHGENRISLFDFDTVQKISDIQQGNVTYLSYSQTWAALEQRNGCIQSICEATDIYSIGAVMFWLIMDRNSNAFDVDRTTGGKWDFRNESKFCGKIDHRGILLIKKIFSKTLKNYILDRYEEVDELLADLIELCELTNPGAQYIIYNAPVPVGTFTDRQDKFQKIEESLDKQGWLMISGVGGIGKTELVKEYIQRNRDKYNTVCFLHYDGDLVSTIGISLPVSGYEFAQEENMDVRYNVKMDILKSYDKDTLIVIDNFNRYKGNDGKDQSAIYDKKFDEVRSGKYHIIFTSRITYDDCLKIGEMEGNYQIELFCKHYAKAMTAEEKAIAMELFSIINGHTLTLTLIAKTLSNGRRVSLKTMLEKISENLKTNIAERVIHEIDGKVHSDTMYELIDSIFDVSGLSTNEQYILLNMTLVPHIGIDTKIFGNWIGIEDFNNLDNLIDTGWISIDRISDTISLHPVIADVLANKLEPDSVKCTKYIKALSEYCYVNDEDNDNNEKGWKYYNHALTIGNEATKRIKEESAAMGELKTNLGRLLRLLARYDDAQKHLADTLGIYQKFPPSNYINLSKAFEENGSILEAKGEHKKAITSYKEALEILQANPATDPLNIARMYNHIGKVLFNSGEYDPAVKYALMALDIQRSLNSPSAATSYHSIGMYNGIQLNYIESLKYKMMALKIREENLPSSHQDIAISCESIGVTYRIMGNYDEALKYHFRAFSIKNEILPENHPSLATTLSDIGVIYGILGENAKALDYHLKAFNIRKKSLPPDHYKIALSYNNVGKYFRRNGDYDSAIEYHLKALGIYESRNDPKSPTIAGINNQLGIAYRCKGEINEALEFHFRALKIHHSNYSQQNHPRIAITLKQLGEDYIVNNEFEEAIKYLLEALEIEEKILTNPEAHTRIADTCEKIGRAYMRLLKYEDSFCYYFRALKIYEEKLPANHPKIRTLNENIGVLYSSTSDQENADIYFSKSKKGNQLTDKQDQINSQIFSDEE